LEHAYWLGKAAKLAYQGETEIQAEVKNWGFDQFAYFCGTHQMPFPLEDTQAYLAASDHMIIVAFRGTEPSTDPRLAIRFEHSRLARTGAKRNGSYGLQSSAEVGISTDSR